MADASRATSLYAVTLLVARLDATGKPAVGPDNLYITESVVRLDRSPQYNTVDPVTKTDGRGRLCLNAGGRTTFSGLNLTVELCEDDAMLHEILGGGSVLTTGAGADVIGYRGPTQNDPDPFGVALELWTEAWSGEQRARDLPWYRWVFPLAKLRETDRSLSAEADEKSFEGTGAANAAYGTGARRDWTFGTPSAWQWARTAVAPPAPTDGYAAIAAPPA